MAYLIIAIIVISMFMVPYFWSKWNLKNNPDMQKIADEKRAEKDERNKIISDYRKKGIKFCPYCLSTDFQYAGQQTFGARDAKTKTQYSLNLNPLKPFTIANKKEKVVKKAKSGYSYDEFICLKCGKRFR